MPLSQEQIIALAQGSPQGGYSSGQLSDAYSTGDVTRALNTSSPQIAPSAGIVKFDGVTRDVPSTGGSGFSNSGAYGFSAPKLDNISPESLGTSITPRRFYEAPKTEQQLDNASGQLNRFGYGADGKRLSNPYPTNPRLAQNNIASSSGGTGDAGRVSRYGGGSLDSQGLSQQELLLQQYLENPTPPKTEEQLVDEQIGGAQELVNSIQQNFNNQLEEQSVVNRQRSAETNAQSVLSGLGGSTEAGNRAVQTTERNAQSNKQINDQRQVQLLSLYNSIKNDARTEARQQERDYRTNATGALASISARREKNFAKTVSEVVALGKEGTTIEGLQSTYSPQEYKHIVDAFGGEAQLRGAIFASHASKAVGEPFIIQNKAYQYVELPNGTRKLEEVELPEGFVGQAEKPIIRESGDDLIVSTDGGLNFKVAFSGKPDTLKQLQIQKAGLDIQRSRQSITEGNIDIQKKQNELLGDGGNQLNTGGAKLGTREYIKNVIADSSRYGKTRLLADERKNISAAQQALGSLETYNQIINGKLSNKNSKEIFGDGTGIIKGRLRTLAGQLGGDANAAAINATITGLIPTVARGIFHEVGVLTDADIANYKKTVPNINAPENANKLIELVLLRTLERTYGRTLSDAANNQTNVSNFLGDYEDIVSRVDKLSGEEKSIDNYRQEFPNASDEELTALLNEELQ